MINATTITGWGTTMAPWEHGWESPTCFVLMWNMSGSASKTRRNTFLGVGTEYEKVQSYN